MKSKNCGIEKNWTIDMRISEEEFVDKLLLQRIFGWAIVTGLIAIVCFFK